MFLLQFLKRHYLLLSVLVLVSIVAALLEGIGISLVFPILQGMTESSLASVPFPFNKIAAFFAGMPLSQRLQIVAGLLFTVIVIKGILLYVNILLSTRLQILAMKESRMACIKQVMRAGMNYFYKQKLADFQLILSSHTETVVGFSVSLIGAGIAKLFTALILLYFLFLLSWKLTVVSLALVVASSFIVKLISRKVLYTGKVVNDARHDFNTVLFEVINGMKLIRQFSREYHMVRKYRKAVSKFNKALFDSVTISHAVSPIFETVGIAILCLILIGGSFMIPKDDAVWIGILLTFIIILSRLIPPVKVLNQTFATLFVRLPALQELDQFLMEDNKEFLKNGTKKIQTIQEGIEYRNISFSYNPGRSVVLKDLSFKIPKGSKIGIVGPSGSGKSTIIELLMRFYDLQKGEILIDGVNVKDLELESWRKHIGVVAQDTFLFNDTIRANIAFAEPYAPLEKIEEVARRAHIHGFIKTLPNGYDTQIGERGIMLSGGQRQRLAIARAILTEPEILIFDEATSALDTESEQIVQNAMDEIARGKTVITIAHRLSTVRDSDLIVVIDDGKIVEVGKHSILLENQGLYRKLVEMQSLV